MQIISCPKCGAKNRIDERAGRLQPVCGKCGTKLDGATAAAGKPVVVTDETFQRELQAAGDKPFLVDCWAPWCGPCRMIGPIIDELAAESNGRYVIGKLNTDENQRTAAQFSIDSIPALLIFKQGKLLDRLVGLQPKSAISARLTRIM